MVKAGLDVLAVVVTLLLIEGGFCLEALQCGPESQYLCPPPLPLPTLVADVLHVGTGSMSAAFLRPRPLH